MATKEEEKELWVAWTHDAINAYTEPDDLEDDELIDDMVEAATGYADAMLDEYRERFSGGTARRRSKRKKPEPDPDDD